MNALIIDDERLARNELRRLLAAHPEIHIAGEAADVDDGIAAIGRLEPELIFLDIAMPGGTGFDLLAALDAVPLVIFTTAFDEYALRAFEVSALDYLVKPIEPARLARAVARVLDHVSETRAPDRPPLGERQRIFVKDGDKCWLVELADVFVFESVGNYTRLHFQGQKPLIARSLGYLEQRLDPTVFFRASRNQIINLNHIAAIEPWFHGKLLVRLEGGHEVMMSRRRSVAFRETMRL